MFVCEEGDKSRSPNVNLEREKEGKRERERERGRERERERERYYHDSISNSLVHTDIGASSFLYLSALSSSSKLSP